jgi:hypothetical protein
LGFSLNFLDPLLQLVPLFRQDFDHRIGFFIDALGSEQTINPHRQEGRSFEHIRNHVERGGWIAAHGNSFAVRTVARTADHP